MRVIYAIFPAGLSNGQLLHTETGVTILAEHKYFSAQKIPEKISGILPDEDFQRALNIELGEAGRGTFPSRLAYLDGKSPDYVVREVDVSEAIGRGLAEAIRDSEQQKKPKVLTTKDKPWVLELISQFPEFKITRIFREV